MNRIRQLRDEFDWKQNDLASKLNVKEAAVSKYENEKVPLTADTISLLCDIFDCSADYLLGLSNIRGRKGKKKPPISPQEALAHEVEELSLDELKDLRSYVRFLKTKRGQEPI
jgi:transcriptional regulator with XRE-family HTH domain